VATGTTTTVTTNGSVDLPTVSVPSPRGQTGVGLFESGNSPALNVTIDTTIVATIVDVSPNPHQGPVSQMTISFWRRCNRRRFE